jgi:hypothetical protein
MHGAGDVVDDALPAVGDRESVHLPSGSKAGGCADVVESVRAEGGGLEALFE